MGLKQCSDDERAIISDGAMVFGTWCQGKPADVALAAAMAVTARLAAHLAMDEADFVEYAKRSLRDGKKARELQRAVGPYTETAIDGERRILLPREANLSDPL